jgi:hypothetical protein
MQGIISLENNPFESSRNIECDLGIQVLEDGRIWIWIDDLTFINFLPKIKKKEE